MWKVAGLALVIIFILAGVILLRKPSSVQTKTIYNLPSSITLAPTKKVSTNEASMELVESKQYSDQSPLKVGETMESRIDILSKGQPFNAAQGTVEYSPNFTIVSLTPGDCNFTFITKPTPQNPTFAGAILGGKSTHCTLLNITFKANSGGTGSYHLINASVLSASGSQEMLPNSKTMGTQFPIVQ